MEPRQVVEHWVECFNRARKTSQIINAFFSLLGSAFSVVPC